MKRAYLPDALEKLIGDWKPEIKTYTYRAIRAVKVSEDHGETWKLKALCEQCWNSIEPPKRRKVESLASVRGCEWCGCRNFQDLPEEEREKFYPEPIAIFTARMDSPEEMAELKDLFGADALHEAYREHGPDEAMLRIMDKAKAAMAKREGK